MQRSMVVSVLAVLAALVLVGCDSDGPSTPTADAAPIAADAADEADATPAPLPDAASDDASPDGCDGPEDCGGAGRVCCQIQTTACVEGDACRGLELCHQAADCRSEVCCPQGFCGPGCD